MWAPEDGRGAAGGPWGARSEAGVEVVAPADRGDARFSVGASGNDEDLGALEVEMFYEDDLEFQIASF